MPDRTKKLLVEGEKDKRLIPWLMEANHIEWLKGQEPVDIVPVGGFDGLIDDDAVATYLKGSNTKAVGIIFDADEPSDRRWTRLREACCRYETRNLPEVLPPEGLVVRSKFGPQLGFWMMPDNQSRGMLETFLCYLVPEAGSALWNHAQAATSSAKVSWRAPFKERHLDKAEIYTWLAWQDEPGCQLHEAVKHRILDPCSPFAQPFVAWFRRLFEL